MGEDCLRVSKEQFLRMNDVGRDGVIYDTLQDINNKVTTLQAKKKFMECIHGVYAVIGGIGGGIGVAWVFLCEMFKR